MLRQWVPAMRPTACSICTSEQASWFGAVQRTSRVDPLTAVDSVCFADSEDYLLIATQECAGASIRWGIEALGFSPDAFQGFEDMAAGATRKPDMAMFFPWFAGERVLIDDERIREGLANLSRATDRAQIAFALYEGVGLNARWAMRPFDRLSERAGQTLRMGGGAPGAVSGARFLPTYRDDPFSVWKCPNSVAHGQRHGRCARLRMVWRFAVDGPHDA